MNDCKAAEERKIIVCENGPYIVSGDIPLVRKTQVVSEYGEPLNWQLQGPIETDGEYALCRCGGSEHKPFCDCTHVRVKFNGAETADPRPTARRQAVRRGTGILVKRDLYLCMSSGFCANRLTNVDRMTRQTGDPQVRGQVMAMIEHCPSGSYSYALAEGEPDVEPDLPAEIAVVTEITSAGPIAGPLWVTGGIPVERADGEPFETRNRVTLCCCGKSKEKPLCDGSHRPHDQE
ncbi:MAG TPA: CDGSH iron-sulfur domain-containing protein [Anaerolineae bacterium]